MSNYTTELRYLLAAGYVPSLTEYPIFDEAYRTTLNKLITEHFYFREIGLETADRFDWFLRARMNEIMPTFNILYKAQLQIVNPLYNFSMNETNVKNTAGTNVSSTASTDNVTGKNKKGKTNGILANSDTPQGNLSIMDLTAGGYASNVQLSEQTFDEDTNESASINSLSTAGEGVTTEDYIKTVAGTQGVSNAELFNKIAGSMVNINNLLFDALSDLFMGVY